MRRSARGLAEAQCMGLLELAASFASERSMLRSLLGMESCAALAEVRAAPSPLPLPLLLPGQPRVVGSSCSPLSTACCSSLSASSGCTRCAGRRRGG